MSPQQKLALGFLLWGIFATTVMFTMNWLMNKPRKPQVITIDLIMSMPTYDSFRLASYDTCDETESFAFCDYHYQRDCACLATPAFIEDYSPHEIVLPFCERIEVPWDDDTHFYPYEWRLRLGNIGRKPKANK
jgi:hypothetical protein